MFFKRNVLPVCRKRSGCSILAFVLKGNHSIGAHLPGACFDFIKCKFEKILLEGKKIVQLKPENKDRQRIASVPV